MEKVNNNIVYCVVQIDWAWTNDEPRPSIILQIVKLTEKKIY